jgi:hypothetical protein
MTTIGRMSCPSVGVRTMSAAGDSDGGQQRLNVERANSPKGTADIKNYNGEGGGRYILERGIAVMVMPLLRLRNNYYLTNTLADVVPTLTT